MSEIDINSVQFLFKKAQIQALSDNQQAYDRWSKYKADNVDVQERLKVFLKSMNVPVMVPIGNKAMFKGKLVHTNDIYISLGEGYFIKGSVEQALEVSKRRIDKCDQMLESLHKERQLLESRANITDNLDAFPNQGTSEIIENYDPEEENKWKEEHSKKVKEYRQQLAELKETEPKIDHVEDLFKRLDLLEMQEELEDELDRLVCTDDEDEEYDSSSDESENEVSIQNYQSKSNSTTFNDSHVSNSKLKPLLKNVGTSTDEDSADDCIRISFKHSSRNPHLPPHNNVINSPADIYSRHCLSMKEVRKPFKKVTFLESTITKPPEQTMDESSQVEAFGDVIERSTPTSAIVKSSRPTSKFKISRK